MSWPKAFAAWIFIAIAESIHGTLRRLYVLPVIGDLRAHQVGVLIGCLIIFAIALACIRWVGARTLSEQLRVGTFWMVLMASFEVSLGLAFGYSLDRILLDYNIAEGRFMIFGMVFMLFAPALAAKARGKHSHSANNSLQAPRP
jgi:hypothetical protein